MYPKCFLKIAGKSNNCRFYLPNFLKFCDNISHKLLRPSQSIEKIYGNSWMVPFAEINQVPSPYSMLQHIERAATPKLVPRNCLRCLQTTLIMGGRGLVSEFMWGIVGWLWLQKCIKLYFWSLVCYSDGFWDFSKNFCFVKLLIENFLEMIIQQQLFSTSLFAISLKYGLEREISKFQKIFCS